MRAISSSTSATKSRKTSSTSSSSLRDDAALTPRSFCSFVEVTSFGSSAVVASQLSMASKARSISRSSAESSLSSKSFIGDDHSSSVVLYPAPALSHRAATLHCLTVGCRRHRTSLRRRLQSVNEYTTWIPAQMVRLAPHQEPSPIPHPLPG